MEKIRDPAKSCKRCLAHPTTYSLLCATMAFRGGTLLRRFDLYPKFHDEFCVRTQAGGALSLLTFTSLFVMSFFEVERFMSTTASDRVGVDMSMGERLQINLIVTFMHLPCSDV